MGAEINYWRVRAERAAQEVERWASRAPGSEAHRLALAELHQAKAKMAEAMTHMSHKLTRKSSGDKMAS